MLHAPLPLPATRSGIDELGIGLTCFPGMASILHPLSRYIDVLEIGSLAANGATGATSPLFDPGFPGSLAALPQRIILHDLVCPVGGTLLPARDTVDTLNRCIRSTCPLYTSQPLGFDRYCNLDGDATHTGILLPLLQNEEGILTAIRNIRYYKHQTGLPFALCAGPNCLQPRNGEMEDGEFLARVAEDSDSQIVLDLFRILRNARNGRQPLKDLLRQLPPERIIGIRLTGDPNAAQLLDIADTIVRDCPCLKSIIWQIAPEGIYHGYTNKQIRNQLHAVRNVWDHRGRNKQAAARRFRIGSTKTVDNGPIPELWEYALGNIAIGGQEQDIDLQKELLQNAGLPFHP